MERSRASSESAALSFLSNNLGTRELTGVNISHLGMDDLLVDTNVTAGRCQQACLMEVS
jgi:hypothetical protein